MGYYNFTHKLPDRATPSDWLAGMVANVEETISYWISTGLTRKQAITQTKAESCAGPKVWEIIETA